MRLHPGEVEATGWRVEKLSDVVERLFSAAPDVVGRPRLIAIDGRGGAGKSTLVERLRRIVPGSAIVHTDDIAWNHACFDWGGLFVHDIVRPLHRGGSVDFRPRAWTEHDRAGAIRVPAGADVVWVEGTGIIREEFAPWIDASIWVQGDLDEQERRLVARDGDSPAQQQHIAGWLGEELPLMLREQPWARATVVVAGTTGLVHDPDTEIVVAAPAAAEIWGCRAAPSAASHPRCGPHTVHGGCDDPNRGVPRDRRVRGPVTAPTTPPPRSSGNAAGSRPA